MSDVKLNCPDCKTFFSVSKQELDQTSGLTFCPKCQYEFRLVKKNHKKTEANNAIDSSAKTLFENSKPTKPVLQKKRPPLNYRIPKAADVFADVSESEPFSFNLLDRNSVQNQLPQVSVKPSISTQPAADTNKSDGQQNNITIHTDSLVFTLLGDGQTTSAPMIAPLTAPPPPPSVPVIVAPENNMNWTIATIGALIVLIMQLFYYILFLT